MPSAAIDRVLLLLGTTLFGEVSPAELEPLARSGSIRRAVRGEHIFDTADAADAIYVVASGQLKDAIYTEDGAEVVHSLWQPGMILGEVGFFARQRTRVMSLVALEPSTLLVLGREPVTAFMTQHPAVAMRFLEHVATTSRWQTEMIASLARRPLAERVLLRLLDLAESNGSIDGEVAIAPRVSQTTLASMVGASRENVNRALGALATAGTIRTDAGRYVIADPDRARRDAIAGWPLVAGPEPVSRS